MALPAGPATSPPVMMLKWLTRPLPTLEAAARAHGDVFTLRLPVAPPFVVFSRPDAVKDIFTADPDDVHAGEANVILRSVLGENSLLVLDGQRHLRERKLMMPPFHGERMRAYGAAMRDATLRRMTGWPLGKPFPLHAEMQAITLEVILRAVFGVDDDRELDEMREAIVSWATLGTSRLGTALLLLMPVDRVEQLRRIADTTLDLGVVKLPIGRLAPWSRLTRSQVRVRAVLRAQIERRMRADNTGREDVLSMLLQIRDEDGRPMTVDQLEDEMLTLLIAGHETTATTLAWTVHLLLQNPDVMARVRDGGDEWVDAAIKESLRLRPVVPLVGRVLKRAQRIGGVDLPEGAIAIASIYLAQRRPDAWPDPLRYDPSRFIGKKIDPYAYFPFGGGTRRCLGMAFASYEMKIVLGTILSTMKLRPAPGRKVRVIRRGITFAPSGGMPVIAEKI